MNETGFSICAQTARTTAQAHRQEVWDRLGIMSWWAFWTYGPLAETQPPLTITGSHEVVEKTCAEPMSENRQGFVESIDGLH